MQMPRIGCSGWNYKSWRGHFYPRDMPAGEWLTRYSSVFDTVEVNGTFYRLPEASTFAAWREQTPARFLLAIKASRYLTHLKRLREPEEPLARLFDRARELGPKLGPVLYQLPGHFHRDLARLEEFLRALPARVRGARRSKGRHTLLLQHVIEFRHPSWYVSETFQLLADHDVALCLHDKLGSEITEPLVGPCLYVRFHGTSGHYHGSYDDRALERWAGRLVEHAADGVPVYAYFNNDPDAIATENALTLRRQVEHRIDRSGAPPVGHHAAPLTSATAALSTGFAQPTAEVTVAKYGKSASKRVKSAMSRKKKGTLKSGSGQTVKSRKQAIAIGLSEAREKGAKVPARKSSKGSSRKRR